MTQKRVGVVIPARNEGDEARNTLISLRDNSGSLGKVILVDDGSTDGCCDFARNLPWCQVIRTTGIGVGPARNLGAEEVVDMDYVVFADAHIEVRPGWLEEGLMVMEGYPNAAVVCPAIHTRGQEDLVGMGAILSRWIPPLEWQWKHSDEPMKVGMTPGMCQIWRSAALLSTGGFTTCMAPYGAEDMEIGLRAWLLGWDIITAPNSHVVHLFKDAVPNDRAISTLTNELRLSVIHLSPPRLFKIFEAIKGWPPDMLEAVWRQAHSPETLVMRDACLVARVRTDDDWFAQFDPLNELAEVP